MAEQSIPSFAYELEYRRQGFRFIAGVDEAGRGALAGPVAAAAVIVPELGAPAGVWAEVRDSKQLRPAVRETLAAAVRAEALAHAVGMASAAEIDEMGIAPATRLAMTRAIAALQPAADFLLIDWVRLSALALAQVSFARADALSVSVAAASILAKVARDAHMVQLDALHPGYAFAAHKGYGAPAHLAALQQLGPCPEHRHSFAPIARQPSLFDAS
ncbi:MAG: ribonuclease HII [Caldilineaceae bacterium]|nr:ribonuclease HII [Caldilineaceae bacterium]MCB9159035.1 ribonuclease HII [Caldilineaceae bacterium]